MEGYLKGLMDGWVRWMKGRNLGRERGETYPLTLVVHIGGNIVTLSLLLITSCIDEGDIDSSVYTVW